MRMYVFLSACAVLIACQASAVSRLSQEQLAGQRAFLSEAIVATPYSAVVKHTRVEVIDMADGEFSSKHIFYADVIETIRGEERSNVHYTMFVEHDEEVILDNAPVILTLCIDDGEYYWPGVGAQFHVNQPLIQLAKSSALRTDTSQSHFEHCD